MNSGRYLVCGYIRGVGLQVPVCKERCVTQEEAIALAEKWMEDYTVQVVDTLFLEEFLELRERSMVYADSGEAEISERGTLQ